MKKLKRIASVLLCAIMMCACKIESVEEHQNANKNIETISFLSDSMKSIQKQFTNSDSSMDSNVFEEEHQDQDHASVGNEHKEKKNDASGTKEETQNQTTGNEGVSSTPPAPAAPEKQYVTISIDVLNILNHYDKLKPEKQNTQFVPSDGMILHPIQVEITDGDTVFDVLLRVSRMYRIHMEYQGANANVYNSVYVQGINNIYEFDCGELSGWMFTVNGNFVNMGAGAKTVNSGDVIKWRYTCDNGRDLN